MSRVTLAQRVAALEKQVGDLLAERSANGGSKDWRRTRGAFTGDELMQQIFAEGRKIREAERKRARVRDTKKRSSRG